MGGGARTLFFGLIGIMIALSASFVLYQRHQQRTRELHEKTAPHKSDGHRRP